jgi:hypothetical protein
MLDSLRSRAVLASLLFVIVACEDGEPTPAYGMSPAAPPAAQMQLQDDGYGDPSQAPMQTQDVPVGVQPDDYADTDPSALTDFHAALDPHGTWVDDPTYGTIWVPNVDEVGSDFAPYVSNGGWEYDDDYVWNSYYEVDSGRWGWIPGRRYAGAWVNWRTGPEGYGYVGWGPMQPSYVWRGGVAMSFGVVRPGPVVFCGRDDMFAHGVGARVIVGPRAATIAAETHEYVRADAVAGGRVGVTGQGVVRGPPPASLGIRDSAVVHVSPNERGFAQARGFARPSTAQAMGAHAPAARAIRVTRPRPASVSAPRAAPASHAGGRASGGGGHRR